MTNQPIITVIMPTYNRASVLPRAIYSVLNQTFSDFELIVVDDGSTDNTESIVRSICETDTRVIYLKSETNKGGSAARNRGIQQANGNFIAFQDSDVEWYPDKLKKQYEAFESLSDDCGVVYTGFYKIRKGAKTFIPGRRLKGREGQMFETLLKKNIVDTPSSLIRKKCLDQVNGFDERLPRLQDWDLFLRISQNFTFKLLDEPLYESFELTDSLSLNRTALVEARAIILKKYYEDLKKYPKILVRHYFNLAFHNLLLKEYGKACSFLLKSLSLGR